MTDGRCGEQGRTSEDDREDGEQLRCGRSGGITATSSLGLDITRSKSMIAVSPFALVPQVFHGVILVWNVNVGGVEIPVGAILLCSCLSS